MPFEKPDHEILLYHGTTEAHNYPSASKGLHNTDFGQGYYLTSVPFQAEDWARGKADEKNEDSFWVYEYAVQFPEGFPVLTFREYDESWLNFVADNRMTPNVSGEETLFFAQEQFAPSRYGAIIGGIADRLKDRPDGSKRETLPELLLKYQRGDVTAPDVLRKITPKKSMDQYCFRTDTTRLLRRTRGWRWTRETFAGNTERWIRRDASVCDDKRLELLAAMYAHITGDTEAEAKKQIKRTRTGKAIAQGGEIYLYFQPTHNMEEIAQELPPEVRAKFTYEAIYDAFLEAEKSGREREQARKRALDEKDRAFMSLNQRERPRKRTKNEKARLFETIPLDELGEDEDDEEETE